MASRKRNYKTYSTSTKHLTAEERETAERIAGGNRYPDRAALRGKVRRMTRQREALERAERRELNQQAAIDFYGLSAGL